MKNTRFLAQIQGVKRAKKDKKKSRGFLRIFEPNFKPFLGKKNQGFLRENFHRFQGEKTTVLPCPKAAEARG